MQNLSGFAVQHNFAELCRAFGDDEDPPQPCSFDFRHSLTLILSLRDCGTGNLRHVRKLGDGRKDESKSCGGHQTKHGWHGVPWIIRRELEDVPCFKSMLQGGYSLLLGPALSLGMSGFATRG